MKVSLIRHGRPIADQSSCIRAAVFPEWLRAYDNSGLDVLMPPPDSLKKSLASCALLLTSPARRAMESADLLGVTAKRGVAVDAREAPLPTGILWPFAHRPVTFVVVARILWLLGFARSGESKREVGLRSRRLVCQLTDLAGGCGHVALVGHGYMNILLRKQFEKAGWRSSDARVHGYWSCSHFENPKSNQPPEPTAPSGRGAS
jgi:hypothetical protein